MDANNLTDFGNFKTAHGDVKAAFCIFSQDFYLHIVYFLDITFDLLDRTYKPYKKPNNQLLCVNTSSNHPSKIIKQL